MSAPDGPEEREADRLELDTYDHDVDAERAEDFEGWAQAALDRLPDMSAQQQCALSEALIKRIRDEH